MKMVTICGHEEVQQIRSKSLGERKEMVKNKYSLQYIINIVCIVYYKNNNKYNNNKWDNINKDIIRSEYAIMNLFTFAC